MKSTRSAHLILSAICCGIGLFIAGSAAHAQTDSALYHNAAHYIHQWDSALTDVMMDDGRSPCTIGRIYTYTNIAAYEAALPGFPMCRSMAGQVAGLTELPRPVADAQYDWRVSSITAFKLVADNLVYRDYKTDSMYTAHMAELLASGVTAEVIERSTVYGDAIAKHIIKWLNQDGFAKIQASNVYVIPTGLGMWEATPPDFKEPVDPFWGTKMRPFTLRTTDQYKPDPQTKFSTKKNSDFYKQAMEVYTLSKSLTDEQILIAKFWDCNPIHSIHRGHMHFFTRQISPGGHWISIAKIAMQQKNYGLMESLETYVMVSLALADGFTSCWTEKYKSNGMRPVTYINRYIDSTWEPLIQTPPFPEHASGHSTISAAAATVLTHIFGDMPFDDDTEVYLQMPVRRFNSFMEAAHEAAMSRLLGGIHFRHGNEAGKKNGIEVGEHVWRTVRTRV